jgi:hypothetical protein
MPARRWRRTAAWTRSPSPAPPRPVESGYGWKGSQEHVDTFLYRKAVCMNTDD